MICTGIQVDKLHVPKVSPSISSLSYSIVQFQPSTSKHPLATIYMCSNHLFSTTYYQAHIPNHTFPTTHSQPHIPNHTFPTIYFPAIHFSYPFSTIHISTIHSDPVTFPSLHLRLPLVVISLCNLTLFPACECDPTGSYNGDCRALGGLCECKPNVIGRKCDQCAPGTYGFGPNGCQSKCSFDFRQTKKPRQL